MGNLFADINRFHASGQAKLVDLIVQLCVLSVALSDTMPNTAEHLKCIICDLKELSVE